MLAKFLERAAKALTPGVVFDTFGHPDPDQALLSPMPGLAYSLILASLGEGFGPFREKEPSVPEKLWPVLEEHALEEAVRFASALIADYNAKTKQVIVTVSWRGAGEVMRSVSLTTIVVENSGLP